MEHSTFINPQCLLLRVYKVSRYIHIFKCRNTTLRHYM